MKERPILKSRRYLYATEFFSGMSVMAVELGASRLLAPYFSSSQIVWTIIIGAIMIAMALGNVWGGRAADKNPDPDALYRRLLVAALWIAAIPFAGKYVILGISGLLALVVRSGFLVLAAFLSCLVLFVFPLFLLGTVTPSLARYTVERLEDSGKVVGTLGAFNTVGSIIGTFLPTFVTIPAVGTAATFLLFAGVLLVIALIYFISARAARKLCVLAAALFAAFAALGAGSGFAFWEDDLTYEGESVYNYLQVRETEDRVVLSTNVLFGVQSVMMKEQGLTGMYYDWALAAPVMAGAASGDDTDLLVLGMGTGTFAAQCAAYFPAARTEGVEIDAKITALARQYFALPAETPVTTEDGRAFLRLSDARYDVIMVDAYQDITIPFQMSTAEFFALVREHLTPGGVMVVNMNMRSGEDGINGYLADTIVSVFGAACTADVPGTTNRELFAVNGGDAAEALAAGTAALPEGALRSLMEQTAASLTPCGGGTRILTDDRAPVELLGMQAIDAIITDELDYYRQMFRTEGISGVLKNLS